MTEDTKIDKQPLNEEAPEATSATSAAKASATSKKKAAKKPAKKPAKKSTKKSSDPKSQLPAVTKQQVFKITDEKKKLLNEYEDEIRSKLDSFLDVVVTLRQIQSEGLWKCHVDDATGAPLYETFEDYTVKEFDLKRAYYSKLNAAARAYTLIEEADPELVKQLPKRCNIYYQLSRVKDGQKMVEIIHEIQKDDQSTIEGTVIEKLVEKKFPKKVKAINKTNKQMSILLGLLTNLDEGGAENAFNTYIANIESKRNKKDEVFDKDKVVSQLKAKLTALLNIIGED